MDITHRLIRQGLMLKAIILGVFALALSLAVLPLTAFGTTSSVTIPVEQIFNAQPGAASQGTFSYVLTPNNAGQPMPTGTVDGRYTFSITGSDTHTITISGFPHAGYFFYTVRAAERAANDSYTLDDTVYTIIVKVINLPGGGLSASLHAVAVGTEVTEATKVDEIIFDKSYAFAAAITGSIPVIKTVQGHPAQDYTFTFRLTALTPNAPMPTGATGNTFDITITGSGREYFGTWTHTTPGVFVYEVREIDTGNRDYDFDDTVYRITDTVTDENGQLVVSRVIVNAETNAPVSSLAFINNFTGGPGPGNDDEDEDVPVAENDTGNDRPGTGPGGATQGPKTGDYADPIRMIIVMVMSAAIALFALFLIYFDRRSEREHTGAAAVHAQLQ